MAPPNAFHHMIRCGHSYFVPRRDGELVVGATNEDAGFDRSLTPAGVGRLLMDAQHISSYVGSYPIKETWTGLRPATPDGLPVLGESAVEGLLYATGHYRNGILLAPITAAIISAIQRGNPPFVSIDAFSPSRFERGGLS
jgi:glycine oxidase